MEEAETGLPPLFHGLQWTDYGPASILYGIISPVIILLTLINNVIAIIVFYIDPDEIDPTSVQSTSIAISNTLIGIFQLPIFVHFFSVQTEHDSVQWCTAYRIIGYVFPFILHTLSKWQLIGLSLQRLLCYRFPYKAVVWYDVKLMLKVTLIISFCAIIFGFCRFFDFVINDQNSLRNISGTFSPCEITYRYGVNSAIYQKVYTWIISIFEHIVPCFLLLLVNILLIFSVRALYLRRAKLANNRINLMRARQRTKHEASTVVLLTLVLLVEIPYSVVRVSHTTQYLLYNQPYTTGNDIIVTHFLVLLSFPFYIYIFVFFNERFKLRLLNLFHLSRNEQEADMC